MQIFSNGRYQIYTDWWVREVMTLIYYQKIFLCFAGFIISKLLHVTNQHYNKKQEEICQILTNNPQILYNINYEQWQILEATKNKQPNSNKLLSNLGKY